MRFERVTKKEAIKGLFFDLDFSEKIRIIFTLNLHNSFTTAFGLFRLSNSKAVVKSDQSPVSPGEGMIRVGTKAQWRMTMTNFASKDLTAGELNALVKKVGGDEKVRKILSGKLKIQLLSTSAQAVVVPTDVEQFMTVNPDLAFAERIKRGNYGWRNSDLTEKKFPVTEDQHGEWEWKLFHFHRSISSEDAIRLMKEDGYEAGQIGHILTFGEINPEEQRKYPIIGLGSVAEVGLYRYVPELWDDYDRRELGLSWFDDDWYGHCRFLGVRRRTDVSAA